MIRTLRIAILLGLLASLGLAGCGVRGQLERPADAPKADKPDASGEKPHEPFILDRIIE